MGKFSEPFPCICGDAPYIYVNKDQAIIIECKNENTRCNKMQSIKIEMPPNAVSSGMQQRHINKHLAILYDKWNAYIKSGQF